MNLSPEQVRHIAKLARIAVSDDEVALYQEQMSDILNFVDVLNEVETTQVEPMEHVTSLHTVTRNDEVEGVGFSRLGLIEAFPDRVDDVLKVKAVFS